MLNDSHAQIPYGHSLRPRVIPFGSPCSVLGPIDSISYLLLPCQISLILFCSTSSNIWVCGTQGSVDIQTCAIPPVKWCLVLWQANFWLKVEYDGCIKSSLSSQRDPLWMSLPWASTWPFWRRTAASESISRVAFLMVILINTLPHVYTQCLETFRGVMVSAEGATSGMNICW